MSSKIAAHAPDVAIVAGVGTALVGVYLLVGLAIALIVGGVLVAAYGVAADLRWR